MIAQARGRPRGILPGRERALRGGIVPHSGSRSARVPFTFTPQTIADVVLIQPRAFGDARGDVMETYRRSEFAAAGITDVFVQANHARSTRGTLRGLHFQKSPGAQGKLVRAVVGEIFDVAVDLRPGSPTFGRWVGQVLNAENRLMLYVPPGCAHGFAVHSDRAEVVYQITAEYAPALEAGIIWNDPALAIPWGVEAPLLSPRDQAWPTLAEYTAARRG
jgi:dTDP-4-dehydrorhamnose 3,5-epimerase